MRIGPLSFLVLVLAVVAASGATPARADVPPADMCTSPGQPCQNAGAVTGPGQPGTCVEATCMKYLFQDGGLTPMTYPCHRCEAPDGGTAGGGGTAGAAGGTGGAAGKGGGAAGQGGGGGGSSSGCAVAGSPTRPATAAVALWLGLLTILLGRRRSRV